MRISDWSSDVCSSDLRIGRRKGPAIVGISGLEQDRVPLRHAIEIQGTANTEEFALVIELMEGSRLQEHAALLVADDRARLIAVPQSLYDLHIFKIGRAHV